MAVTGGGLGKVLSWKITSPSRLARAGLIPTESTDGKFDDKAMATMRRAVIDLGILDAQPDIAKLYTEDFLPKTK